jgi:hypothetical protein
VPEQSTWQVADAQTTDPSHDFWPVQLTKAVFGYSLIAPAHDPDPEQVNVHELPVQTTSEAQAFSPAQVI